MTEDELLRVEQTLDVKLPAQYRDAMLNYPAGIDDPRSPNYALGDCLLPNAADAVIALNMSEREFDTWPKGHFVFGHDGGECTYCLDLTRPDSPVLLFDMENTGDPGVRYARPRLHAAAHFVG